MAAIGSIQAAVLYCNLPIKECSVIRTALLSLLDMSYARAIDQKDLSSRVSDLTSTLCPKQS